MKKILVILALMLPIVVFTACEKDEEKLVGTWLNETESDDDFFCYFQINADHTGLHYDVSSGVTCEEIAFTWSSSKDYITLTYLGETLKFSYSLKGEYLTVTNPEAKEEKIVLRRVN